MKSLQRRFGACLMVVALAAAVVSCRKPEQGPSAGNDGPKVNGDWLVVRIGADPDTFNPLTTATSEGSEIGQLCMYETLIGTDNNTLADVPMIADSLPVVSPDHLHYTYHLRKDVKFSDGVPVTGNDFIFYLKALKNPLVINAAPKRSYYSNIMRLELVNGDPYTLTFTLSEPYFLANQWCGNVFAMPKHIWDPNGLMDKVSWEELSSPEKVKNNKSAKEFADWVEDAAKGRDPKFLVGSGKYIFESWETGQKIAFHRNPNYWNPTPAGGPYIDKIIYKIITDDNAALTALKGGEIDFMPNVPKIMYVSAFDSVRNRDIAHQTFDYPTCAMVVWNFRNPLFQDARVRLALAKLMNTEEIIKSMLKGLARPVASDMFFNRPEFDSTVVPVAFDPEGAKKLLADAGWVDTDGDGILDKDGKKFEFSIMTSAGSAIQDKIVLISMEAMRKAGIVADIQRYEFSIFVANGRAHKFDAAFRGWSTSATEGDPFQTWHSSQTVGGSNAGCYNSPEMDQLIQSIRGEFDWNKRIELHRQIQRVLAKDQPAAFLYAVKQAGAWNARFKNVHFYAPRPCYDFSEWWVPKDQQKYGLK